MMDHKTYLQAMSPDRRAALTAKSNAAGVRHLALHLGVILLLGGLIALRVPFWPLLMLPQGVALVFLFTLQHETTHKTPFASETLNEWIGWFCGLVIAQPFLWFRYFHLKHHRYTNIAGQDPELDGLPKPNDWPALVRHLSTVDYWIGKIQVLCLMSLGRISADYLPERVHPRLRREAQGMLLIYIAAFLFTLFVSTALVWIWLVPLILGFPILRLYLLAEHGRCPQVADMFLNTRTTYTTSIVRFLAWNMPYHIEHHVFPQVPFHLLPRFHEEIRPHLGVTSDGYGAFAVEYVAGFESPAREDAL
ncbi:MAG: fatty acid desaturase [Arenibacterium sp.]